MTRQARFLGLGAICLGIILQVYWLPSAMVLVGVLVTLAGNVLYVWSQRASLWYGLLGIIPIGALALPFIIPAAPPES